MSAFQLLECSVALAGDTLNVVSRGRFNPVTYPEMLTLKYLHGEHAVTDIYDVGYIERDPAVEMGRLIDVYGSAVIKEKMFPGAGLRLPQGDNGFKPRVAPVKAAPSEADLPTPDATQGVPGAVSASSVPASVKFDPDAPRAAPGPGTAATTPVNYGGGADQTGGDYVPNGEDGGPTAALDTDEGLKAVPSNPPADNVPAQAGPRTVRRGPVLVAPVGGTGTVTGADVTGPAPAGA